MEIQNENYFQKQALLNDNEIITIAVDSNGPNSKAKLIHKKLKDYCFINNDNIYILDTNNITFRRDSKVDNILTVLVSKLLEQSVDSLKTEKLNLINSVDKKRLFFKNSEIGKYLTQLKMYLTQQINVDVYLDQIHFNNGYVNLVENKLHKRKIGIHFVTKYIDYDYDESLVTEEMTKKVKKDILRVYPTVKDRDAMMWKFGRALTGRSPDDQGITCSFGAGSSGKTTIVRIMRVCMPPYIKMLKQDALSYTATNIDKVVNTFASEPQVRLAAIDDPKDTKLNDSVLKNWANGEIDTLKLYSEGSHSVKLYCMLMLIMNTIIQTKMDSGVARRMKNGMFEHQSKFVDNKEDVDKSKNIYLKNTEFEKQVAGNIIYKIAFCKYLFEAAKKNKC